MLIHNLCITLIPLISCWAAALDFPKQFFNTATVTGGTDPFVGDDLRLTCNPTKDDLENYTVYNISFSFFKPSEPGSTADCLPMSLVHVNEDEQSAALVVHNVTVDVAGQYTCHIGRKHCLERQDPPQLVTVGSVDVTVEYSPHNVSQFICVFNNWNDFAECTWKHPVNYVSRSNINISVGYTVSFKNHQVSAYKCPHLTDQSCKFNSSEFFLVQNYVIEVNVTNIPKDITASKIFIVDTFKAVKPAPVIHLSHQSTPGCISLSWNHSRSYEKIYRIRHQNVGDSHFQVVNDNISSTHLTLCGYQSYTHHIFEVDCYPAGAYSGYWSDRVSINASTPMTAPNLGPTTINGSYTSTKCVNNHRNVTLMWQDVKESERNGIINSYLIKLGEKILKHVTSDAHLTVVELLCSLPSELTIFAHNEGGYSVKPSVMVIPPDTFAVPGSIIESFAVEISANSSSRYKESLRAVWNMTEVTGHLHYTLFWCLGLPGGTCEGPINWSEVPGSMMDYDFPILDAEAQKYLFGISKRDIQTGRASSIFWTGCLFRHLSPSGHVKPVNNMHVESGLESVLVAWSPLQCSYQNQLKISNYIVKGCQESSCNDTVFHFDVPAPASSYMVSHLTANVPYKFTVQPVADGQAGEEVQPWRVAKPHAAASQNKYLWILAILVIPVVLITVWKCLSRRKHTKRLTQNQIIEFPDNLNDSPQRCPVTSPDHLMQSTVVDTTIQPQTNSGSALIIPDEDIPDQATSASTSEDSSADDPTDNSRTRLIKQKAQKEAHRQLLPQAPDYIHLEDICEHAGSTSALRDSPQESNHAKEQNGLSAEKDSSKDGWSPASLTTGAKSEQAYVWASELKGGPTDICVQDSPSTHIPAQIRPHSTQFVLCVKRSNETAEIVELGSVDVYSNMAEEDFNVCIKIHERPNPDDTVANVEPTDPSVLEAQGGGVDLGQCDNKTTSSGFTDSDMRLGFPPSISSGHVSSHSSSGRQPGAGDYVRHNVIT